MGGLRVSNIRRAARNARRAEPNCARSSHAAAVRNAMRAKPNCARRARACTGLASEVNVRPGGAGELASSWPQMALHVPSYPSEREPAVTGPHGAGSMRWACHAPEMASVKGQHARKRRWSGSDQASIELALDACEGQNRSITRSWLPSLLEGVAVIVADAVIGRGRSRCW